MRIDILSLFPQVFEPYIKTSILGRAKKRGILKINLHNLRKFGIGKHKVCDDTPYGGHVGMILRVDVIVSAIEDVEKKDKDSSYKILFDPRGKVFSQKEARFLSKKPRLLLVCGHYEGIDERVSSFVDQTYSIGDYILAGGEAAAIVLVDTITRLIPNVIAKQEAHQRESFDKNLLEYPQYTKPPNFRNLKVPKILFSGDRKAIEKWRKRQQIILTKRQRPDLFQKFKTARKD